MSVAMTWPSQKQWNAAGAILLGVAGLIHSRPASAQIEPKPFPAVRMMDAANIDIQTTMPFWTIEDVAIGIGTPFELKHSFSSLQASFSLPQDSFEGGVRVADSSQCPGAFGATSYPVVVQGAGECFYLQNGIYTSDEGRGGILEYDGIGTYTYTTRDGTQVLMSTAFATGVYRARTTRMERPDGLTITVHYDSNGRINAISNGAGFRLQYNYSGSEMVGVAGYNAAYLACDPALPCAVPAAWPRSQVVQTRGQFFSTTFVTAAGETTVFSGGNEPFPNYGRFEKVQLPANVIPSITYKYCPNAPNCTVMVGLHPNDYSYTIQNFTVSATVDGQTWTYGMANAGPNQMQRNSTSPTGSQMTVLQRTEGWHVWTQVPGTRYNYSNSAENRITSVVRGQGDTIGYTYDARGNITQTSHTPAPGFSGPALTDSASYPMTCGNRVTCNKPTSVTDARGNTTVYTYDPIHGGVLTSVGPTDANGVARSVRYAYVQRYARYLDQAGNVVQTPTPIWLLESERACRTSSLSGNSCSAPNDEVVTLYDYGPQTGVNNLLLRGVVRDATGVAARTCYSYDRLGNRISETSPNAQLGTCL